MANSADPDQLVSSETNWSGSTLFAKGSAGQGLKQRLRFCLLANIIFDLCGSREKQSLITYTNSELPYQPTLPHNLSKFFARQQRIIKKKTMKRPIANNNDPEMDARPRSLLIAYAIRYFLLTTPQEKPNQAKKDCSRIPEIHIFRLFFAVAQCYHNLFLR